ncbi:hypothetical protein FIU93_28135 [Labrenzia sp. THAF35]|uniref:hypothetical protein n=1 Tax=Labrenzia sp. THAF35 TaxID=2587854 RepID=UPI001268EB21|nr:hypothetical protein [Labrenzia sp. THAF35]QFT70686.1 hypothetical protein FIU93_28135 [Labrenzia sp. THAF35]
MPTDAITAQLGIPKPDPANNVDYDFTRIILAMEMIDGFIHALQTALAGVAPSNHTHVIDDVDGLQAALNALANSIANVSGTLAGLEDTDVSDATQGMLLQYLNEKWVSVAAKAAFFAIDPINGLSANNVQAALAELVQEVTTPTVDPSVASYECDGETDTFTLPATPNSKNAVILNLNGVSVLHEDFTLDGSDVTLSYKPPDGITLNALVFTAVEIGAPSLETVGFAQLSKDVSELALIRQALTASGEKPFRWNHAWNPFMKLNTRGQAAYSANGYTLDRWYSSRSGAFGDVTREVLTRGEDGMPFEILHYLQFDVTTGSDYCRIEHRWPSARQFAGKTITVVFLARGVNPGGGSLLLSADQYFGAASATPTRFTVDSEDIILNPTWTIHAVKMDVPDIDGVDLQSDSYFSVRMGQGLDASTDAWRLNMTGFLVIEGDVRDEFTVLNDVVRHYRGDDVEKDRCNFFCRMIEGYALQGTVVTASSARFSATYGHMNRDPDVTLATSGAISVYSNGFRTFNPPSIGSIGAKTTALTLIMDGSSGMTVNQPAECVHNGNVLLLEAEV